MKKRLYQFIPLILLFLLSCSDEIKKNGNFKTRTFEIELSTDGGELSKEVINTARFIVFDNASTHRSELDINKRIDINDADRTATGLKVTLEVSDNKDKMIVAILNEPEAMRTTLDANTDAGDLESLHLDFAEILNNDHHTFLSPGNGMPMTGVVWAGDKYGYPVSAPSSGAITRVPMTVERAVACVAVYLKAEGEGDPKLPVGAKISLANTYDKGYLVTGTEADNTRYQTGSNDYRNFGLMQTIDPTELTTQSWECEENKNIPQADAEHPDGMLAYYFYTPERTCVVADNKDKLVINIEGVSRNGGTLETKTVVLDKMLTEGKEKDITTIKRNNIYKIIGTVTEKGIEFTAEVLNWEDSNIDIREDGIYTLSLSTESLMVPSRGVIERTNPTEENTRSLFEIKTNYPGNWVIEDIDLPGFADVKWHAAKVGSNTWEELIPQGQTIKGLAGNAKVYIECGENIPYDTDNFGSFHVRAGRIRIKVQIRQTVSINIGWFAGELKKREDGNVIEYKFTKKLYVREDDDNDSLGKKWADVTNVSHSQFAGSKVSGKKNTYLMATYNGTDFSFPAAENCFNSNKTTINGENDSKYVWYLPAHDQLIAIWIAHNTFALDETADLYTTHYWCATEVAVSTAGVVNFTKGSRLNYGKTIGVNIRCVREE